METTMNDRLNPADINDIRVVVRRCKPGTLSDQWLKLLNGVEPVWTDDPKEAIEVVSNVQGTFALAKHYCGGESCVLLRFPSGREINIDAKDFGIKS
jgi:hypothetical protein